MEPSLRLHYVLPYYNVSDWVETERCLQEILSEEKMIIIILKYYNYNKCLEPQIYFLKNSVTRTIPFCFTNSLKEHFQWIKEDRQVAKVQMAQAKMIIREDDQMRKMAHLLTAIADSQTSFFSVEP